MNISRPTDSVLRKVVVYHSSTADPEEIIIVSLLLETANVHARHPLQFEPIMT